MAEIKANHICKNPECRKHYYACDYCGRSLNWRSVACSFACYQKYMDLVIAERSKGKDVEVKPERTDMTEQERFPRMLLHNHRYVQLPLRFHRTNPHMNRPKCSFCICGP